MIRTCIGRVTLTSNRFTGAAIRFISTEPTRTRSKGELRLGLNIESENYSYI